MIMRMVGIIMVVLTILFIVGSGGWGIMIFFGAYAAIPYGGMLLLAVGHYLASNWKYK